MRSTIRLLHRQQEFSYSCLAACACMILARLGKDLPEAELRALLKTRASTGTHPIHFRALESLGVEAIWPHPATLADVHNLIENDTPVIVFLWTAALKHWPPTEGVDYLHAAVVVGFTDGGILLHDPRLASGPTEIPLNDFSNAWALADHLIAYVRPRE